jgi:hypothetical protein
MATHPIFLSAGSSITSIAATNNEILIAHEGYSATDARYSTITRGRVCRPYCPAFLVTLG